MSSEIAHTDISDRQLIPTGTTPRKSLSREIGEAEVVHNIFGRARVRIVRKEDEFRRSLWWILLAVMVAIVAGQVWLIWQHQEEAGLVEIPPAVQPEASSMPAATDALAPPPPPLSPPVQQPAATVVPAAPPAAVAVTPRAPSAIAVQPVVRPVPPAAGAASAVVAPTVPRRVVRPLPAPVAPAAASAPAVSVPAAEAGVEAGAATPATQQTKPALPADSQP